MILGEIGLRQSDFPRCTSSQPVRDLASNKLFEQADWFLLSSPYLFTLTLLTN
jgi:hypothetical protein